MKKTVQIQSVIYRNEKSALYKALNAIKNASLVCRKYKNEPITLVVFYGDASPEPVFSQDEVDKIINDMKGAFEFKYTFFNKNTGSAKGHNLMGKECHSEYMLIMNPDVIVSPNIFSELFLPFSFDKNVGMVEARQTPIEHSKEYHLVTGETEWATTACALFPKKLFDQVNGFDDESFFLYCDDLDFSWRIRLEGYKIIYQPRAVCFHAKRLSQSGKWKPTNAEKYYSAESAILMAYKWSNNTRVKYLLNLFRNSGPVEQQVVAEFEKRQREGRLPKQLDKEHKVARFVGDYFADHRFFLI